MNHICMRSGWHLHTLVASDFQIIQDFITNRPSLLDYLLVPWCRSSYSVLVYLFMKAQNLVYNPVYKNPINYASYSLQAILRLLHPPGSSYCK